MRRILPVLLMALLLVGCGRSSPALGEGGSASRGDLRMTVSGYRDGVIEAVAQNAGQETLSVTLVFSVERLEGDTWVSLPWPEGAQMPRTAHLLPGGTQRTLSFDAAALALPAGDYRLCSNALQVPFSLVPAP